MIRVVRTANEPQKLEDVRNKQLGELRKLIKSGASPEEIKKKIAGYKEVRDDLWELQHHKCCYCEKKIETDYNDVEHYRPKLYAEREPGSKVTDGYWWLAFTWTNLLFACPNCNRSNKKTQFPLTPGDIPLQPEETPHGFERPLILDPADTRENPVAHIEFKLESLAPGGPKRWHALPRNRSLFGSLSIAVYGLNRGPLIGLRDDHIKENVKEDADDLNRYLDEKNVREAKRGFEKAMARFAPPASYVALSYDAYRHYVPNHKLGLISESWPNPDEVGLPRAQRPVRRVARARQP